MENELHKLMNKISPYINSIHNICSTFLFVKWQNQNKKKTAEHLIFGFHMYTQCKWAESWLFLVGKNVIPGHIMNSHTS